MDLRSLACFLMTPCLIGTSEVGITVDWSAPPIKVASTAATVEVDVMPFLGRTPEGGPFSSYYESLENLGSEFVRYAPWFPYPRVAVTELTPPDCTDTKPATNWNSTLFDGIVRDFMAAVCGPRAIKGECRFSVAQQLSTMPSWLYVDGSDISKINPDPWEYNGFGDYNHGTKLKDETCQDFAAYMTRVVQHYTAGGHHDSCGHWHPSGFYYKWTVLSVLNENEHNTGGERYTRCFDEIRKRVEQINPYITLAGPETSIKGMGDYSTYFLDPKNHPDGRAPAILSNHAAWSANGGASGEQYFSGVEEWLESQVLPQLKLRDQVAPKTEMVLNEYIPFMNDWCDEDDAKALFAEHGDTLSSDPCNSGCPSWQDPRSNPVKINRKTLGWNAAAGCFAYGYARLALLGYKYVGADQLIGGPWPDNEPAVSCLDWKTGQPNAKYWSIHMLASALGAVPKSFLNATYTMAPSPPPAVGTTGKGTCGVTSTGGDCDVDSSGAWDAKKEKIVDLAGCVAKAKSCKMGNFVSYSSANADCSWYSQCDLNSLLVVNRGYVTKVLRSVPAPQPSPSVFALPYIRQDNHARGVLLVSKKVDPVTVTLEGAGLTNTIATILEGVGAEPGFTPPVVRVIGGDGKLSMGPYGIALVDAGIDGSFIV